MPGTWHRICHQARYDSSWGIKGLELLLIDLEDQLFEMTVPELQDNMDEYFTKMTRKDGESMRVYVGRAKRMHDKLQRSIARIERKYREPVKVTLGVPSWSRGYWRPEQVTQAGEQGAEESAEEYWQHSDGPEEE